MKRREKRIRGVIEEEEDANENVCEKERVKEEERKGGIVEIKVTKSTLESRPTFCSRGRVQKKKDKVG